MKDGSASDGTQMTKTLLFIGLPETGKTSFLAAFWYMIQSQLRTLLTLAQLPDDREYLNSIMTKWLTYEEPGHTQTDEKNLVMHLKHVPTGETADYNIPDLSGETFNQQWLNRSWDDQFESMLNDSAGTLLFVHPDKIVEPVRIAQVEPYRKRIAKEFGETEEPPTDTEPQHDPAVVPTQVELVALLQFIRDANVTYTPYKISIIISAWDLVRGPGLTPDEWLKQHLPLLSQYLSANTEFYKCQVFGVSAQGADYDKDMASLQSHIETSNRIQVVSKEYDGHDITTPLAWIINDDE